MSERLAELLLAATPRPWEVDPAFLCDIGHPGSEGSEGEWDARVAKTETAADAELIVLAVNAYPGLLAELERQQELWSMQSRVIGALAAEVPDDVRARVLAPLRPGCPSGPRGAMGKPGGRRETVKERLRRWLWNAPWNAGARRRP